MRRIQSRLILFLFGTIAWSACWASAKKISWVYMISLGAALAASGPITVYVQQEPIQKLPRLRHFQWIIASAIILPSFVFLAMTWRQNFPFVGDHDFQLLMALRSQQFWASAFMPIALLCGIVTLSARKRLGILVAAAAFGLLFVASLHDWGDPTFLARYPGTFHAIAFPLYVLKTVCHWAQPLNANRLANFLALPTWLLVLRPWLMRRWPDFSILPLSLIFFFQKDVIYYFTTSYLEPWSLCLILLAGEEMWRTETSVPWRAYLLIGAAAMVKEAAILVIPVAVVAGVLCSKGMQRLLNVAAGGFASVPFVIYYFVRKAHNIWRTVDLAPITDIFSHQRIAEFAKRLELQFGLHLCVLAACIVLGFVMLRHPGRARRLAITVLGVVISQPLFFFCEQLSQAWTGYPRFHLIPLAMLACLTLPWADCIEQTKAFKTGIALIAAIALSQAPSLYALYRTAVGGDSERNFFEHYDAPVYFPVHEALHILAGTMPANQTMPVHVVSNMRSFLPAYSLHAFPQAYPELTRRYRLVVDDKPLTPSSCICGGDRPVIIGLFVRLTGLSTTSHQGAVLQETAQTCFQQATATCTQVQAILEGGVMTGFVAVSGAAQTP